jgi:hypothetical protein
LPPGWATGHGTMDSFFFARGRPCLISTLINRTRLHSWAPVQRGVLPARSCYPTTIAARQDRALIHCATSRHSMYRQAGPTTAFLRQPPALPHLPQARRAPHCYTEQARLPTEQARLPTMAPLGHLPSATCSIVHAPTVRRAAPRHPHVLLLHAASFLRGRPCRPGGRGTRETVAGCGPRGPAVLGEGLGQSASPRGGGAPSPARLRPSRIRVLAASESIESK